MVDTSSSVSTDPSWKAGADDPAVRLLLDLHKKCLAKNIEDDIIKDIEEIYGLINKRNNFCESITSKASPELQNIIEVSATHPWQKLFDEGTMKFRCDSGMLSGNMESQLLRSLVSISNAKKVLELGLFTGLGALAIAESLPADGVVYSCELQPYLREMTRGLVDKSPHGKKVVIKGPAKEALLELAEQGEKVDLVFMDSDKKGYVEYLQMMLERGVLAPRGTVVVDNSLYKGYPYTEIKDDYYNKHDGLAIKNFNAVIVKDENLHRVSLPVKDGITIIRRRQDVDGAV